jgi:hypothetical protein
LLVFRLQWSWHLSSEFLGPQIGEKEQGIANTLAGCRDGQAGPAVTWPRLGSRWQHEKAAYRLANANAESTQAIITPVPPHTPPNRGVPIWEHMPLRRLAEEIHLPRFRHGSMTRRCRARLLNLAWPMKSSGATEIMASGRAAVLTAQE